MTINTPLDELAAKARRVHDAVTLVRGRARSADGHVTVEVDATGRITALTIADAALSGGAQILSASITDTHRRACHDAEAAAQVLRDELAADPFVARIIAEVGTGTPATPRPPVEPADEEDDTYYRSGFLRQA